MRIYKNKIMVGIELCCIEYLEFWSVFYYFLKRLKESGSMFVEYVWNIFFDMYCVSGIICCGIF